MEKKSGKHEHHNKHIARQPQRDLLAEQESIANLRKYHMAIQNVHIPEDMRKFFQKPPERN